MFNIRKITNLFHDEEFINAVIRSELMKFYDEDNTEKTRAEIEASLKKNSILSSLSSFHVIAGADLNTEEYVSKRQIRALVHYKINQLSGWSEYIFTLQCYPWAKHLSQIVEEEEKLAAASVTYAKILK